MGTDGLIYVDRGELLSVPGSILKKPLGKNDVHLPTAKNHRDNWLECVKTRKPPIADVGVGAHSVTVCHLGNLAYWHHRTLALGPQDLAVRRRCRGQHLARPRPARSLEAAGDLRPAQLHCFTPVI